MLAESTPAGLPCSLISTSVHSYACAAAERCILSLPRQTHCMLVVNLTSVVSVEVWTHLADVLDAPRACHKLQTDILEQMKKKILLWASQQWHAMQAARTMSGVEVSAWGAVQNWRTWYLAVINLCDSTVKYAIIYWCPLIIYHMVGENMPHTAGEAVVPHDALVALLTALPFGFAAVFMLVNARHSAATGQLHSCTSPAILVQSSFGGQPDS